MSVRHSFARLQVPLHIDAVELDIAALYRPGHKTPILFLHGFGSSKEDYADLVLQRAFDGHGFLAYDAPGCGESHCADPTRLSIPFLRDTALAMLAHLGIERCHLVGHSMGGLTALLLAHRHPQLVASFVNIEGNVDPQDCFLSRQIHSHPGADDDAFFAAFIERTRHAPAPASALYAASLRHKVRPAAVRGIFESMVELSDHGRLMDRFLGLPLPKMFMYGEYNATLSYLPLLAEHGVALAQIPGCGHFPMYSNPLAMWQAIANLHGGCGDGC